MRDTLWLKQPATSVGMTVDKLRCTSVETRLLPELAMASLPTLSTDVAELGAAAATNWDAPLAYVTLPRLVVVGLRHVIAARFELDKPLALITPLPLLRICGSH